MDSVSFCFYNFTKFPFIECLFNKIHVGIETPHVANHNQMVIFFRRPLYG